MVSVQFVLVRPGENNGKRKGQIYEHDSAMGERMHSLAEHARLAILGDSRNGKVQIHIGRYCQYNLGLVISVKPSAPHNNLGLVVQL